MAWDHIDEKKIKTLIKQLSGTMTAKDGEPIPYCIIKGRGQIWCYQISSKTFIMIPRGTRMYVIDWGDDNDTQCLAYSNDKMAFTIDKDEIEEIGFD